MFACGGMFLHSRGEQVLESSEELVSDGLPAGGEEVIGCSGHGGEFVGVVEEVFGLGDGVVGVAGDDAAVVALEEVGVEAFLAGHGAEE